jgi:NADP-dependent 3-hydroxy acid dehydrogenase YdfG
MKSNRPRVGVLAMKPCIVVTGASSGIGRELAGVAAREGYVMVLIGRSQRALDELATELNHSSVQAHPFAIDLVDRDAGAGIENQLAETRRLLRRAGEQRRLRRVWHRRRGGSRSAGCAIAHRFHVASGPLSTR